MEEELIKHETAVLAKEKGFNIWQNNFYHEKEIETFDYNFDGSTPFATKEYDNENTIYAPTQFLLQKWLREEHNIHISIRRLTYEGKNEVEYNEFIYLPNKDEEEDINIGNEFPTYEEALENALIESLKLIEI